MTGTRRAGAPAGIGRWLATTNHKDVGSLYLLFALAMFFAGVSMALAIQTELFQPGLQVLEPLLFNQMVTMHGLVMVFGAAMPAFVGLASWQIPLMIGAPDVAFPRMNSWSFWLLPFAFILLLSTLFMQKLGGAPSAGWTLYPPLSVQGGIGTDFAIMAIPMVGISAVLSAINIIATILNMRAPGMTLKKMPMFVWTWLITAFLLLAATPVLVGAVTMLLADRHFGTQFFNAAGGGDPVLWQHLFWFSGQLEIYALVLPAFGVVSTILPTFARKPLFGHASMVIAAVSIAFLSLISWGQHLFTVGMPTAGELFFMFSSMLIVVPVLVTVFCWVTTIWRGSMTFETPMLFALGVVLLFTVGGLSGFMLAIAPAAFQYQGTRVVVAHLHYVLVSGAGFAILGAAYYWLPKWTGYMYNERLGQWHFWLTAVGFNVAFFPQFLLGFAGMSRRVPDYALPFADFSRISTVGAFLLGFAQIVFVVVVWQSVRGGHRAEARAWEGAEGLEWALPSPPPYHSFAVAPKVK
jgi:cytochrome c oxidase subunit I